MGVVPWYRWPLQLLGQRHRERAFLLPQTLRPHPVSEPPPENCVLSVRPLRGAPPSSSHRGRARVLGVYAQYLSKPFRDAWFQFFKKTLGGQAAPEERWKQCVFYTDSLFGELLGKHYLGAAFPGPAPRLPLPPPQRQQTAPRWLRTS